ncbi:hypothetical protein HNO89_002094 [Sporosarcina luteola]|nr:hypothetical protein [Sporosarcina luteola]
MAFGIWRSEGRSDVGDWNLAFGRKIWRWRLESGVWNADLALAVGIRRSGERSGVGGRNLALGRQIWRWRSNLALALGMWRLEGGTGV